MFDDLSWCIGYIEGEGTFVIGLQEIKSTNGLRSIRVHPQICVSVIDKDIEALKRLQNNFGGTINKKPKEWFIKAGQLNAQDQFSWRLDNITDTLKFCEKVDFTWFKTSKINNLILFHKALIIINEAKHLTKEGLIEIIELRNKMNPAINKGKNYKNAEYFLKIVNEMEKRNLFSPEMIEMRKHKSNLVLDKAAIRINKRNKDGYELFTDQRRV